MTLAPGDAVARQLRLPPYSAEAEQSVLGGLLLEPESLQVVAAKIGAQHFYEEAHRLIFAAITALVAAGSPVDTVTVFEHLRERNQAEDAGGLPYLHALTQCVPSARNAGAYADHVKRYWRKRERVSALRAVLAAEESASDTAETAEFGELRQHPRPEDSGTESAPPFKALEVTARELARPEAHGAVWGVYIPEGLVTVLSGHGGVGKSLLAMQLLVCIGTGRPLFGIGTRRSRIAFFSAEDGADLLQQRLLWVCRVLGIDPAELDGWVHLLDAADGEPVLFHDVQVAGQRIGTTTGSYAELGRYLERHDVQVLIVDNMSDAFDGNEIERAKVRAFMRSLPQLRSGRRMTVLLLAHVDKGTARGERSGSEAYSGSTAVHNSARSRIYLARERDGQLRLEHQKNNLGPMAPPLLLSWPDGQLPQLDQPVNGHVQALVDSAVIRQLLRLIGEFTGRGEFISTSVHSQDAASKLLAGEPGYPRDRKPAEVQALLRSAERDGLLQRHQYRNRERKERERWELTDKGRLLVASVAPTAPGRP